jgi:hypothetical protein
MSVDHIVSIEAVKADARAAARNSRPSAMNPYHRDSHAASRWREFYLAERRVMAMEKQAELAQQNEVAYGT